MGQYYRMVNLDKQAVMSPNEYDNGLKLTEHSWLPNDFVGIVMKKLSAEWFLDRIVWAGDYGDKGLFLENHAYSPFSPYDDQDQTLYHYSREYFYEIVEDKSGFDIDGFNKEYPFIVNVDKEVFVDTRKCPDNDGWIVHPLPLLTSNGNGRGNGDYMGYGDEDKSLKYVGTWAGDRIAVLSKGWKTTRFVEITPNFQEDI